VIERILLAVDDSPDSLAAARAAIELATGLGARLRAVHVRPNHCLDRELEAATSRAAVALRRERAAAAILARISALARTAGLPIETELLAGDIAPAILDTARGWAADLVVIGKSRRAATGEPYVGSQTRSVLEFGEQPVLVVPSPHPTWHVEIGTRHAGNRSHPDRPSRRLDPSGVDPVTPESDMANGKCSAPVSMCG
jgi:nucleotide-binding universal stress UspA family protein